MRQKLAELERHASRCEVTDSTVAMTAARPPSAEPPLVTKTRLVGRHGAMNPAGKVRCNMWKQIELGWGDCNFTNTERFFELRYSFFLSDQSVREVTDSLSVPP
jgi:hypothetical protein